MGAQGDGKGGWGMANGGREGEREGRGWPREGVMERWKNRKKGDSHFIQLLDYTSRSPVRSDPIIIQ